MNLTTPLFAVLIMAAAVPIGYLLAYLTKDELKEGREYFKLISVLTFALGFVFLFFNLAVGLSLIFISIVSLISLIESYS